MRTLVEQMLPARFLTDYAVYMQSCAHLELVVWHIVQLAQNQDARTDRLLHGLLEIRTTPYELRKQLRKSVKLCPALLGLRVCQLANEISEGYENRNMAAHGAWHFDGTDGQLRVEHYFGRGPRKDRIFYHVVDPVTPRQIEFAVQDVDRILRSAVDLRSQLYEWRVSRGEALSNMIGREFSEDLIKAAPRPYRDWIEHSERTYRRKKRWSSFWNCGQQIR